MKKKSILILSVLMLLCIVSSAQKEWTVMVFLNGDNNLEGAGVKDVNEMEMIGSTSNVDIVVQFDRARGYDKTNGDWTNTKIFHIEKDRDSRKITSPVVKELGEVDMGSYREAIRFFKWGVKNYPAKRYLFVYWNHGAGWLKEEGQEPGLVKGISYDDESGNHIDSVGMRKVAQAMYSTLGRKMDIVAFDACLMGMVEVAYQQSDYLKYMVASEETEPGDGWPYTPILRELTSNPRMASKQFCKIIVDEYMESYEGSSSWYGPPAVTQAASDLSKTQGLVDAIDELATVLYKNMNTEKSVLAYAMKYAQKYEYSFYKDLYDMCEKIKSKTNNREVQSKAINVIRAINKVVIISKDQGSKMKDSHGLAIYAPEKNEYKRHYANTEFAKNTGWDEMLNRYYSSNSYVAPEEEEEDTIFTEENVDTAITVIGAIIDLFKEEKNMDENSYQKIDALAANAAKLISMDMESGDQSSYEELIKAMQEHPELTVVLEKLN